MITKVYIRGYRKFRQLDFVPRADMNVLVGDNDTGKSTIVEAMCLALTGRINGKPAREELNPYWFNKANVEAFLADATEGRRPEPPTISIEVFFADEEGLASLRGAHNSVLPPEACPGVSFKVSLDPACADEFWSHVHGGSRILPVEFFQVTWKSFSDEVIGSKPRNVSVKVIDGRTIRSTSSVDYHMRQALSDNLSDDERQRVSAAYRAVKEQMTDQHLGPINVRLQEGGGQVSLAMDQTARSSWETNISPHVAGLPFSLAGHGQQAHVKIALAMGQAQGTTRLVFVEEPENHQSHTSLGVLMGTLNALRAENQQVFVVTHSSFVLNRLGTDSLQLVTQTGISTFAALTAETAQYYRRLPGYDTLRIVLARKVVFVEGPSDEMVFQRLYKDRYGHLPLVDGIDVISMGGISLKRCLELCSQLGKRCAALRDLDNQAPEEIRADLGDRLSDGERALFLGGREGGRTLEPQLVAANDEASLRELLGVTPRANLGTWMGNNKTEAAIRIFDAERALVPPPYILEAITFIHG